MSGTELSMQSVSPGTAIAIVAEALKDAMSVNPWLAVLWLLAAVALAALLVYTWRRLSGSRA